MKRLRLTVAGLAAGLLLGGGAVAAAPSAFAATCTTSNVNGSCGPYSDPTVFTSSNGADLVVQNDFSAIPQTLSADNSTGWTVAASTVGQSDQTSVKSYPATQVTYTLTNGMPDPSSDFGSTLTSDFTNIIPSGSNQDYEYAVDDWLADPTKPSWTNDLEVMIWTNVNQQVPAGNDTGTHYTDPNGVNWEVWVAQGGGSTVGPDATVSFVRQSNVTSGTIERMGFYHYLQQHGMLAATYGIDQLNYGLEICSTGGATRTYGISGYNIVPNGTGGGGQQAPAVTTSAASNVTSTGATLNGTVNPEGVSTTYQFQYGTTTSYGSVAPASPGSAGSGTTAVSESAAVSGLAASTTYHYRLNATNATGTTHGSDGTFTTAAAGGGGTSVALDAAAGAKHGATNTLSWTQTVGTGSNRVLLVDETVGVSDDAGCAPSATYDGIPMTEITAVHDNNQRAGAMVIWGLVNPPSGADTVHVAVKNCAGGTPSAMTGGSESFTGVSQSAPFGAHAVNAGAGTSSTVSVASSSSSDLTGEFASDGNFVSSAVAPAVKEFLENQNSSSAAGNTGGGYMPSSGGTDTAHWSFGAADWWGAAAVDLQHA